MTEIVNDSPEKRRIISLLQSIINNYEQIGELMKTTSTGENVIQSRIIYGALRKDIGSAIYHANLQKKWIIKESD